MNKYFYLFLFISALLYWGCDEEKSENLHPSDRIDDNTEMSAEDKVFQVIVALPEYKDAEEQVKAMTNGKQSISVIMEEPNEEHPEYILTVGYNQETWFEPLFRFFVDQNDFSVSVEDPATGDIVPIEDWRKRD